MITYLLNRRPALSYLMSANLWPAQMPEPIHRQNYWEEQDRIHHINGEWRGYYNLGHGCKWHHSAIYNYEELP